MTRLLLVRHAPTPETGKKLTGRLPGVALGATGEERARATAEALAATSVTAVATSPVQRCRETAEIVGAPHGLAPVVEPGLEEVDFGTWQGRTLTSLGKLKAWETVQRTPSRFRFPDGESFVEVQARAVDAVERLAAEHRKETVVACSHADVIKLVVAHYLGMPLDLFQRLVIGPASVTRLLLPPGGSPVVASVNGA